MVISRREVSGAGKTEDGLVRYNEEVNRPEDDLRELYETIRVNVDEEEQWKVFDFVEDFFLEELEIGDYINDINSYHLHMFDKHDVTTKKFDAIVEKAGKVDANYAAQIEGYCSLLGEYGKKFEAVCAMLQPEKLRLSPDKYREKLEGINTGYQNAKDTHEQEQSAYEAELYEIETVWYKKMLDKAEDYLIRSAECVVLGNFTDEVTVLGVGVQIVLGIFDLDLPGDIRDIIADIKNLAETDRVRWDLIGMLALDLIGLIPVIGALKYSDEVGTLFKNAGKVSVVAEGADGVGAVARHADEAGAWLQGVKVFRYSDETAEAVASGEKLLKESGTIYESFADMMSPDDAAKYLDFLENGSKEGLTSAELAGVEKADALLVSRKVEYEDVWDLRNAGDALESGSKGGTDALQIGKTDLDALRHKLGVPETDTIAVGKTDVKGMEGVTFEGQSPKVRSEAGLPDLDEIWAERNIKSPGNNPLFTRHAEEALANDFDRAVIKAGINPQDVSGVLKIHQSNPTGVCRKCIQGLANDNVSPGVLKQLSLKYPNLRIEVTSEILPDVKVIGKSNFVIQNGQYVE